MAKLHWTDKATERLFELYEENPILWNRKHKDFKIPPVKNEVLKKVTEQLKTDLGMQNLTPDTVKGRMKSLRDYHRKECAKIKKSSKCGASPTEVYQPTVSWFKAAEQLFTKVLANQPSYTRDSSNLVSIENIKKKKNNNLKYYLIIRFIKKY